MSFYHYSSPEAPLIDEILTPVSAVETLALPDNPNPTVSQIVEDRVYPEFFIPFNVYDHIGRRNNALLV